MPIYKGMFAFSPYYDKMLITSIELVEDAGIYTNGASSQFSYEDVVKPVKEFLIRART